MSGFTLLFPGQGSQKVGMGKFLYAHFPLVRACFEEACDHLHKDYKEICFEDRQEQMGLTENTQVCLLIVSTALYRVLEAESPLKVSVAVGHSVGEYGALVASQSIDYSTALTLVRARGKAMQEAVPVGEGGMVAVLGLSSQRAEELCRLARQEREKEGEKEGNFLQVANFNSPEQIVLSGHTPILNWLCENFKEKQTALLERSFPSKGEGSSKVRLIPLKVSAPFHCALMEKAQKKMEGLLEKATFHIPRFPIVQNVSAEMVKDPLLLRQNLIRQISSPVLWEQSMGTVKAYLQEQKKGENIADGMGETDQPLMEDPFPCIEMGESRVLSGLMKKIDNKTFKVLNVETMAGLRETLQYIENIERQA